MKKSLALLLALAAPALPLHTLTATQPSCATEATKTTTPETCATGPSPAPAERLSSSLQNARESLVDAGKSLLEAGQTLVEAIDPASPVSSITQNLIALTASTETPSGEAPAKHSSSGLAKLLGDTLVDAKGNTVPVSSITQKLVGLYFSASWCPPCRAFTPELIKFQNKHASDIQIILVGADRNAAAQQKYMAHYPMPWPAIPFEASQRNELPERYGIRGIPSLVILDNTGKLITGNGREDLAIHGDGAIQSWKAKAGQ